jgi:hypothetical protein
MIHATRNAAILTICTALLSGCGGAPPRHEAIEKAPESAPPQAAQPLDPVDAILRRAERGAPERAGPLRIEAATLLLERGENDRARRELASLEPDLLSAQDRVRRALLLSRIALAAKEPGTALALLGDPGLGTAAAELPREMQVELRRTTALALAASGDALAAAAERAALQPWLSGETERLANARGILELLGTVAMERIEAGLATAQSDDWRAWLELSSILRDMRYSATEQRDRLRQWQQLHGALPALDTAATLAKDVEARLANPARVALLLPLSGRAGGGGQAVLQGYLAEHYRQLSLGEALPQLAIADTRGEPDAFAAAYRRAVQDGSELVIGPLLKEELASLGTGDLPLGPTLALNFLDDSQALPGEVIQFGIDSSDEIAQFITSARAAGYTRVLLLADASPRAKRLVDEFTPRWRDAGGLLLGSLYLGDLNEYRKDLERAMLLDQSRERADALARITGLPLETEPRHRADLELVVLLAEPVASRSVRSLLSFLYAGDLPLWGSSLSHSGNDAPGEDLDLEGLRLIDMPFFGPAEGELVELAGGPRGGAARLVALGADAARLQPRLRMLAEGGGIGLSGATGELELGAGGRIHRRGAWFGFAQGRLIPVEARARKTPTPISTEGEAAWSTEAEESVAPQRIAP